jgi:hypothetical protein
MALLAEQVVEEWLTRQGYFTIRGIKLGYDEIDLLAIKKLENGNWHNIHVEVQVSLRPVNYISSLTLSRQSEFNINGARNATKRTDDQLETTVIDWVHKKYKSEKKCEVRRKLISSDDWSYLFVYGNIKSQTELKLIENQNVNIKYIGDIIKEMHERKFTFTTGSATDILELISFMENKERLK